MAASAQKALDFGGTHLALAADVAHLEAAFRGSFA